MSASYEQQLAALGLPDDVVRLHVLDNDIGLFRNRDSEAYGRAYEREQMADHPESFPQYAQRRGV